MFMLILTKLAKNSIMLSVTVHQHRPIGFLGVKMFRRTYLLEERIPTGW